MAGEWPHTWGGDLAPGDLIRRVHASCDGPR